MRFGFQLTMVTLAAGLLLGGCGENNTDRYPAPPACTGSKCGGTSPSVSNPTTGSGGGGGGTPGTGGAGATVEQTGTVHLISSPDFQDVSAIAYAGAATIIALPSVGGMVSAMYGGATGTTFDLKGLPSGTAWLFVQDDTSGATGIISTFSPAKIPSLGSFTIPVIDLGTLQNIASSLPNVVTQGVSPAAAQVILIVRHGGSPYKGVSVTGGSAGAQLAYDSGAGYSDSATATGVGGTVILFNAGLSGASTITLTDTLTNKTYDFTVQTGTGAATLAAVDIP